MAKAKTSEMVRLNSSVVGLGDVGDYLDVEVKANTPLAYALDQGLAELVEVDEEHPPTGPVYSETSAEREAANPNVAQDDGDAPDPDGEGTVAGESMLPGQAPEQGAPFPVPDDEEPSGAKKPAAKATSRRRA